MFKADIVSRPKTPSARRQPEWKAWQRKEHVCLWEAVALSCDLDPRRVRVQFKPPRIIVSDRESKFYDRLDIAAGSLGKGLTVIRLASNDNSHEWESRIGLAEFGAWAVGQEWTLPEQFPGATAKPLVWPWGTHSTELLKHFAAAGRLWEDAYDPQFPATAPLSADIIAFLVDRKVSDRVAEIMAQMLRADGLPQGQRVNK